VRTLANGGELAPVCVESGQNFLGSVRVLADDLLSLHPRSARVVHQGFLVGGMIPSALLPGAL
jgi:hypothetical protein